MKTGLVGHQPTQAAKVALGQLTRLNIDYANFDDYK
jgi:hypothetical protein